MKTDGGRHLPLFWMGWLFEEPICPPRKNPLSSEPASSGIAAIRAAFLRDADAPSAQDRKPDPAARNLGRRRSDRTGN